MATIPQPRRPELRCGGQRPFPRFPATFPSSGSEWSLEVEVSCLKVLAGRLVSQLHPHIFQKGHVLFASLQAEVWVSLVLRQM